MFEKYTYEKLLSDLLSPVPDNIDKREGGVIYDALSPTAVKLAETYIDLELLNEEMYADTASRASLIKRCAERGIYPLPATYAIIKCEFNKDVDIGSRFSYETWNFIITEKIDDFHYKAQCEETGPINGKGDLIPIQYIEGLEYARFLEILVNGENEEDTEDLRKRYFESFNAQAYGGNRADYKEKVPQLQDIGGIKVKRVTETDRNIYLTIINSTFDGASEELVRATQESVDPLDHTKEGYGIAPIGHKVLVQPVTQKLINIESNISFISGYSFEDLKTQIEKIIDTYFTEINRTWADNNNLVVRISQLETKILDLEGVLDIADTKLNGVPKNLTLLENEIAKRGTLTDASV